MATDDKQAATDGDSLFDPEVAEQNKTLPTEPVALTKREELTDQAVTRMAELVDLFAANPNRRTEIMGTINQLIHDLIALAYEGRTEQ